VLDLPDRILLCSGRQGSLEGGRGGPWFDDSVHCVGQRFGPVDSLTVQQLEFDLAVVGPGTFHTLVLREGPQKGMVAW